MGGDWVILSYGFLGSWFIGIVVYLVKRNDINLLNMSFVIIGKLIYRF